MNDKQIIDLYFSRSEQSIKETKIKYSSFCRKIAYNILSNNEDTDECEMILTLKYGIQFRLITLKILRHT